MESFKFLTDSRQQCLAEITAIDNKISELNPEHNELLIIAYYEESIELIKEFKEIKVRCLNFNAHSSKSKSIELNDSVNDLFKDACARIKSIVLGLNKSESRTPQPGANLAPLADNHLRLPPLSIPKLSGENDFEAFYGLFETLVDKQPFDNLVKFHHLYANLSEEPRQIIVSYLPITADGYVAARDALVAHYRNNRRNGMKKLLNILNANVLPNNYSSKDLADLIKNFQGSYAAVLQLNLPIEELHNFLLMTTLYSKLPVGLRRAYEESLDDPRAISTHTNLLNFLQEKVQVSDLVTLVSNDNPRSVKSTGGNSTPTTQNKHPTAQRTSRTLLTQSSQNNKSEIKCPYCKDHHRLYKCNEFLKCSVNKRKAFVSKHELCVRCLNGHSNACKYNFACRLCHSVDHNVLLCAAANGPASPPPDSSAIDPSLPGTSSQNNTVQSMNANISGQTLLPTASVLVRDNLGKFIPMRAVIDSGSQACFLSRSAFQRLQLKPRSDNTFIQGISGNTKSHGKVSLHIRSPISGHETLLTDALIIPQICENLPTDNVSVAVIGQAANLRVADPLWFQSGKIDLLLGANILSKILLDQPNIIMQSLTAQSTMFGYILMGSTGNKARLSTTLLAIDHELTSTVQKIWELDQLPQKNPLQSPEEIECEQHYVKTHSRDTQGRYVVRLPWKTNSVPLCENKFSPIKQLYNLEKSLQRKPSAASAYRDFFNAYIEMEVLVPGQDPQSPYILPHHAVFKADSSTTAVRPVFNCSALDVNGHSLNSMLLKGPNLVQDITDVLLSFRLQPVAITADITKMYTSILLDRRDHPAFLRTVPILWPTQCQLSGDVPELKTVNVATLVAKTAQREDVIERFSTLTRMNRVMSYVFRFIDKCRKKPANSGTLTTEEIKKTLNRVIIIVQNNHQAATDLKGLTPFIDQAGICRVGGRLKNAPLPYDARHPIILPANVHLSLLICRHAHGQTLHGGTSLTRAYIQNQFWIVGITRLVKRVKRDCSKCSRFSNRPPEPLMADLPKDRFLIDKPFANTSCDFAGYFMVRDQLLRTRAPKLIKTYVCIFTCMSTRAVHFEIVQDLTSEAFLAALERFVARRGLPSLIFSDLGTNFVGGNRTLTDIKNSLLKGDDLTSLCASRQITFQFNCPVAAWKNGITERIVSLMKFHLNRTMGTHHLTYPEFMTLITQIEAAINSRPLIPLSVDPNDHILTPGHFLTGSNLYAVPDYDYSQMKPNTLSRWQHVKNLFQQFWKQWSHGYLQTLISRSKWTKNVPDLEVGTVVLVKGDQTPPLMWPLALIKSFKPSADNVRRVAVIKTAHGDLTRPVNKLIPLLNVD